MFSPLGGELPPPSAIILHDKPGPNKNGSVTTASVRPGSPTVEAMTCRRLAPSANTRRYFRSVGPSPMSSICSKSEALRRCRCVMVCSPSARHTRRHDCRRRNASRGVPREPLGNHGRKECLDIPFDGLGTVSPTILANSCSV